MRRARAARPARRAAGPTRRGTCRRRRRRSGTARRCPGPGPAWRSPRGRRRRSGASARWPARRPPRRRRRQLGDRVGARGRGRLPGRGRPSGSPPATRTSTGAEPARPPRPASAVSSIARRFSSSAARRRAGSAVVKKPPRHRLDTRSPESATIAAARASPTSATGSRHSPMRPMPASCVTRSAVARSAYLIVAWLSESFSQHRRRNVDAVQGEQGVPPPGGQVRVCSSAPAASASRTSWTGAAGCAPRAGRRPC